MSLVSSVAWGQLPHAKTPETCKVLEAAYAAAIESKTPAFPIDVRPSRRSLELGKFVQGYKKAMALEPGEFEDLASREAIYKIEAFRPLCIASVAPSPKTDAEGHLQFVSFTNPIFSSDQRLALVEVSFQERGAFGYGLLCIVRYKNAAWSARCLSSWIT